MPQVLIRALRIHLEFVALSCLSGSSPSARGNRCTGRTVARPVWMTNGRGEEWKMLARGFWDATCLGRCGALGRIIRGEDGGAKSLLIMCRHLYSLITSGNQLEMKGGTKFHFVTDGIEAALQRVKEAARDKDVRIGVLRPFSSTSRPDSSTNCIWYFDR